jgi:hypothetical protein
MGYGGGKYWVGHDGGILNLVCKELQVNGQKITLS